MNLVMDLYENAAEAEAAVRESLDRKRRRG